MKPLRSLGGPDDDGSPWWESMHWSDGMDVHDAEPLSSEQPEDDGGVLTPDDVVPA